MKFKSQGQMLSYVKEKEQKIIKEIDRRAEKEGVLDEEKKFSTSQEVDKYLETIFKEHMDSAWKEIFGK